MATGNRDHDQTLSPDEIDQFKVRIEFGDRGEQPLHGRVVNELVELGTAALPLVPSILDQFSSGKLKVAESALVELSLATRSPTLLQSLKDKGVLERCRIDQQCKLLESGQTEFEDRLLHHLWDIWTDSANPWRRIIVESLGRGGGPKALRVLKAIRPDLAGKTQEQNVKAQLKTEESEDWKEEADTVDLNSVLETVEARADQSFLDCVRAAIRLMEERGIH